MASAQHLRRLIRLVYSTPIARGVLAAERALRLEDRACAPAGLDGPALSVRPRVRIRNFGGR